MRLFRVERKSDTVIVSIMPHKDGSGYSYVNLTKGHICPCIFKSYEDAIRDMDEKENIIRYEEIDKAVI